MISELYLRMMYTYRFLKETSNGNLFILIDEDKKMFKSELDLLIEEIKNDILNKNYKCPMSQIDNFYFFLCFQREKGFYKYN